MKGCRKPDCDCIEKAERANGGPVKSYQCLYATVEQGLLKERPRENALPYYCTRRDVLVLVKPTTIEPELRLPYNAGNTLWAILRGQYRKSMDLWLTHLASLPIEATCSGEGFEEGKWYDQAQIYFSMEQRGGEYSPSFVTASLRPVKKEESLFIRMGEWSKQTFADAGSKEHLLKLIQEANEAIAAPFDLEEYADIGLCLKAAAFKAGFTEEDLAKAEEAKFEKVQLRQWVRKSDGTYQHVKPTTIKFKNNES